MATSMEDDFKFTLDVHFAQKLAGNFAKIRDRTVKKLKRWIAARSVKQSGESMEAELMRLWKGLFYCMWMCDKPIVQEELADKIADLAHSFATPNGAMVFFDTFLLTMKREWLGIDRLRMDKYFMFIRRCFRQVLVVLRSNDWEDSLVDEFLAVLCKTPLNPDPEASPSGLRYHFIDIYREELARCAGKELTASDQVMKLIDPFCVLVTKTRNKTLLKVILRGFFQEIVDESDVGFPEESEDEGIDSGEEGGDGKDRTTEKEEDDEEKPKRKPEKKKNKIPREKSKLQYDYKAIADRLFVLASKDPTPGTVRRKVYGMVKKLRDLSEGIFPDYNVGSLMDYQDDDDDERSYIIRERPPKKARRRGGKQVKERRLAKASQDTPKVKSYFDQIDSDEDSEGEVQGEDSNEMDMNGKVSDDEEEKAKKKRKRRKKKKQKMAKVECDVQEAIDTLKVSSEDTGSKMTTSNKMNSHIAIEGDIATEPDTLKTIITSESEMSHKTEQSYPKEDFSAPVKETTSKKGKKRKLERGKEGLVVSDTDCGTKEIKDENNPEMGSGEVVSHIISPGKGKLSKELKSCSDKSAEKSGDSVDLSSSQLNLTMETNKSSPPQPSPPLCPTPATTDAAELVPEGGVAKKSKKSRQPFAVFQAVSTPLALARRRPSAGKQKPQTEPVRKSKTRLSVPEDGDSDSVTPRKRVKIALSLNKAHGSKDYKKQLERSPGIPFDGSRTPRQSVLKTPSPKTRLSKQKATIKADRKKNSPKDVLKTSQKVPSSSSKGSVAKTPSPQIIPLLKGRAGLRTPKSAKSVTSLRRSSRIESLKNA